MSQILAFPADAGSIPVVPGAELRAAAGAYVDAGLPVVIIPPDNLGHPTKAPKFKEWHKSHWTRAKLAKAQIGAATNIGLILRDGVVDVDLDCDETVMVAALLLPPTPAQYGHAARPASHRLYRVPVADDPGKTVRYLDPVNNETLVELRAGSFAHNAQSLVPPSTHPDGHRYRWESGTGVPEIPVVAGALLARRVRFLAAAAVLARRFRALAGGRHMFALALAGWLARQRPSLSDDDVRALVRAVVVAGGSDDPDTRAATVDDTFASLAAGTPTTGRPQLTELIAKVDGEPGAAKLLDAVGRWLWGATPVVAPAPQLALVPTTASSPPTTAPSPTTTGVCAVNGSDLLSTVEVLRQNMAGVLPGPIKYNEMALTLECNGEPMDERFFVDLRVHMLERIQRIAIDKNGNSHYAPITRWDNAVVVDAALHTSERYHPVRSYLDGLTWDGTRRLDAVTTDLLDIQVDESQTELRAALAACTRAWFVSAVARAYTPGCQVDHVLVLVGAQGARKTSFLRVLAGDWFVTGDFNVGDDDSILAMRRGWLVELDELASVRSAASLETLKAFVTRTTDTFRPPYARAAALHPRSFVLAGTTNREEFLPTDPSGQRRWWPIPVGTINIEAAIAQRDQLWAEAAVAYHAGEPWWLPTARPSHLAALDTFRGEAQVEDAWQPRVAQWATDQPAGFALADAMELGLRLDPNAQTPLNQRRVAQILGALGYASRVTRRGASVHRLWHRRDD